MLSYGYYSFVLAERPLDDFAPSIKRDHAPPVVSNGNLCLPATHLLLTRVLVGCARRSSVDIFLLNQLPSSPVSLLTSAPISLQNRLLKFGISVRVYRPNSSNLYCPLRPVNTMCRVHLGVHRPARNWPVEDYLEQCPKLVEYLQKGGGHGSGSWVCVVDHHTVLKAARIARRLVDVVGIYMCVGTDDTSSFPITEVVLCGVTEILGWTRDFCSVAGGYCRYEVSEHLLEWTHDAEVLTSVS